MKKILLLFVALLYLNNLIYSQATHTVQHQFYYDANNNCTYNVGETLIYNYPGFPQLQYLNSTSMVSVASSSAMCPAWPMSVFSPSLPATNTFVLNGIGPNYPGFTPNYTCPAYNNLPYNSGIVYLPLSGISSMSDPFFTSGNLTYTGSVSNHVYPVCSNIGNDSVKIDFTFLNLFTCNNSTPSRTYTLFLNGTQFDVITTVGTPWSNNTVNGSSNMATLTEWYSSMNATLKFKTKLPPGISALGSHTFAIVSSMIYNHALSVINYTCVLNSVPCSNISGQFYKDCNNNCILDAGDGPLSMNVQGKVYNGSGFNVNFTPDGNGNFSLFLPTTASYSLTQYPLSPTYTACTTGTITLLPGASTNTLLYGYKSNPWNNPGVNVTRATGGPVNPGNTVKFNVTTFTFQSSFCAGVPPLNPGKLKVVLKNFMTYSGSSSVPPPSLIPATTGDTLQWTISNFSNPTVNSFSVVISPTISLTTPYSVEAIIYPTTDNYLPNNTCIFSHTIGAPYDPNNKLVYAAGMMPNGDIPWGGTQDLFYTINFQNIGTAPAVNVKTLDTMDVNLDLSTLNVLQSSFPVSTQIDNVSRLVTFMFNGIYLPDSNTNEPGSHGYVRYSIKLNPGVPANTIIKNRGHNYFDFTEPVATNQTSNKLVVATGLNEKIALESGIRVMPNPFSEQLSLSAKSDIQSVTVFNIMGQALKQITNNSTELAINFSDLPSAIYMLSVKTSDGKINSIKVIKQ